MGREVRGRNGGKMMRRERQRKIEKERKAGASVLSELCGDDSRNK